MDLKSGSRAKEVLSKGENGGGGDNDDLNCLNFDAPEIRDGVKDLHICSLIGKASQETILRAWGRERMGEKSPQKAALMNALLF